MQDHSTVPHLQGGALPQIGCARIRVFQDKVRYGVWQLLLKFSRGLLCQNRISLAKPVAVSENQAPLFVFLRVSDNFEIIQKKVQIIFSKISKKFNYMKKINRLKRVKIRFGQQFPVLTKFPLRYKLPYLILSNSVNQCVHKRVLIVCSCKNVPPAPSYLFRIFSYSIFFQDLIK